MRSREEIIQNLITEGAWSEDYAVVGDRAGYQCEYCGLDFLESPENYKQMQLDHIVPRKKGGSATRDNIALACHTCNVRFKSRWDPRKYAAQNATRDQLIESARRYIREKKEKTNTEVQNVRHIVGRT